MEIIIVYLLSIIILLGFFLWVYGFKNEDDVNSDNPKNPSMENMLNLLVSDNFKYGNLIKFERDISKEEKDKFLLCMQTVAIYMSKETPIEIINKLLNRMKQENHISLAVDADTYLNLLADLSFMNVSLKELDTANTIIDMLKWSGLEENIAIPSLWIMREMNNEESFNQFFKSMGNVNEESAFIKTYNYLTRINECMLLLDFQKKVSARNHN